MGSIFGDVVNCTGLQLNYGSAKIKSNSTTALNITNLNNAQILNVDTLGNTTTIYSDLNVLGKATYSSQTIFSVADNLIQLGAGNGGDLLDLGFFFTYNSSNYGAFYRQHGTDQWFLKDGITVMPGSVVTGGTVANLNVNTLTSSFLSPTTMNGTLSSQSVIPSATLTYDLGSLSNYFNNAYVNSIYSSSLNTNNLIYSDASKKLSNLTLSSNFTLSAGTLSVTSLSNLTTSTLPEGANLYYLDSRARASISASGNLSYNSTTGAISMSTTPSFTSMAGTISTAVQNSITTMTGLSSLITTSFRLNSSPISGGVLVSDINGVGTWTSLSGLCITSVSGTSPITASTTLGASTIGLNYNATNLKLTSTALNTIQDIATSSSPSFTNLSLSGNLMVSGSSIIGASSLTAGAFLNITGTQSVGVGGRVYGTYFNTTLAVATIPNAMCVSINPSFNATAGTITNSYGLNIDAGSNVAGTITNAYGLYVNNPTIGTNNYSAYFGGTIGLGTTAPNISGTYYGMDITPSTTGAVGVLRISCQGTDDRAVISLGNHGGLANYWDTGIYRGGVGVITGGNYLNLGAYEGIVFNSSHAAFGSQTTSMIITSAGQVGVGTTSPGNKLVVSTTTDIDGIFIDGTSNPCLALKNSGTVRCYLAVATNASSYSSGSAVNDIVLRTQSTNLLFNTNSGGATAMYISSGGNVGIGTSSPAYTLDINGPVNVSGSLYVNGASNSTFSSTTNALDLYSTHGAYRIGFDSLGGTVGYIRHNVPSNGTNIYGHCFSTSSAINGPYTNTLFVSGTGRVGIGTTSPVYPLDVNGDFCVERGTGSTAPTSGFLLTNVASKTFTIDFDGYAAKLQLNGALTQSGGSNINSFAGNVGIGGNTSPSDYLTIGTTSTTGGITMNNNTANYVPASLNYYEEYTDSSFVWTGIWAANQTGTLRIVRIGKMVTLYLSAISAIANTPAVIQSYASIPARFIPSVQQITSCVVNDNTIFGVKGSIMIKTNGLIVIQSSVQTTNNSLTNSYLAAFSGLSSSNSGWASAIVMHYLI